VETQTTAGEVGEVVKILGNDLTGAASVSFNGTPAVFKVSASSLITTTVPAGLRLHIVSYLRSGGWRRPAPVWSVLIGMPEIQRSRFLAG
jgi:hypothetical protein